MTEDMTDDQPTNGEDAEAADDGTVSGSAAPGTDVTPASTGTGEGGPQTIVRSDDLPSSGGRSARAPHMDTSRREVVTDTPPPERAMVTKAQRRRAKRMEMTRRQLGKVAFWGMFGFGLTGALSAFLAFFWPRGVQGFGGKIAVAAALVPEVGAAPLQVVLGKFWLVNLQEGDGTHGGFGFEGDSGLLALWWKCPHLGCTVPWKSTFNFEGKQGWFRCPCHGSTYTKAGVRVFGPAPRPLDTMEVTVQADGSLSVDTGTIRKGDQDNPLRTVPYQI